MAMNLPESSRIKLLPLSIDELRKYIACDFSFETHFGLVHHPRTIEGMVKQKLENVILPKVEAEPQNHLFHTLWVTIDKQINTAVAGTAFKGPSNENGEVELGAGTFSGFMNRGYMTETTKLLCEWALKNGVGRIIANCSPENVASKRTLKKSGFEVVEKADSNWRWVFKPLN